MSKQGLWQRNLRCESLWYTTTRSIHRCPNQRPHRVSRRGPWATEYCGIRQPDQYTAAPTHVRAGSLAEDPALRNHCVCDNRINNTPRPRGVSRRGPCATEYCGIL
jgi:hypothetical protein